MKVKFCQFKSLLLYSTSGVFIKQVVQVEIVFMTKFYSFC